MYRHKRSFGIRYTGSVRRYLKVSFDIEDNMRQQNDTLVQTLANFESTNELNDRLKFHEESFIEAIEGKRGEDCLFGKRGATVVYRKGEAGRSGMRGVCRA